MKRIYVFIMAVGFLFGLIGVSYAGNECAAIDPKTPIRCDIFVKTSVEAPVGEVRQKIKDTLDNLKDVNFEVKCSLTTPK